MKCQAPNPSISEAQLVRLVREGHIAAFAELFELHKSSIYALCLGSTDVVAEAEELLHAIFLDAFRTVTSSPVYSGFAEVLSWCRTTGSRCTNAMFILPLHSSII